MPGAGNATLRASTPSEEIAAFDWPSWPTAITTPDNTGGRNTSAITTTARALSVKVCSGAFGRLCRASH